MHPWHDIKASRITSKNFLSLIEISKGSKIKYELDKDTGHLIVDRILYTSTQYPHNYGFIPLTYASDFDPLDVLVLCSEPLLPMSFVECKPIGMLVMKDNGLNDEKIIAVAVGDPFYNGFNDISEVPEHIMDEIKHFFSVYKTLEGKETIIEKVEGSKKAEELIDECITNYHHVIEPKVTASRNLNK